MGIARDGLRSLLDALVESVETGGNGEAVAARVHVSRFHFDRIVAAALDETPGAFRRRLLLERAAYALAGGAGVREAAAEGGYLSPEAFARAFRRARGAWDTAFVDATCEPPESFTYGGMAAHVLTWSAHRRHVVLEALERHGVEVEHSDPLGWERRERA